MSEWDGKTKGSLLGYKFFIFSIKILGLPPVYFVLRFVTYYYFLFAKKAREPIVDFYQKTIGLTRKEALKLTRKNIFIFGQTLVDRHAFLLNKAKRISYSFNNEEKLIEIKDSGKGAILLSAHVGNWETAGNLLKHRVTNTINVVMLDAEYKKIKAFVEATTGGSKFNVIPIKNDLTHVIKINNALKNSEFVAIHADRYMKGTKSIELDFFGIPVKFPYGPFLIASKFKVPVVFVFAVKENKNHYTLSAETPSGESKTPEEIAKDYVTEVERMVRKYPEQWFNYYNYFTQ